MGNPVLAVFDSRCLVLGRAQAAERRFMSADRSRPLMLTQPELIPLWISSGYNFYTYWNFIYDRFQY